MYRAREICDFEIISCANIGNEIYATIRYDERDVFNLITVNRSVLLHTVDKLTATQFDECVFGLYCPGIKCSNCARVVYRMVEYYHDRHPLLVNLGKMDYLNAECRKRAIGAGCSMFKKTSTYKKWLLHAAGLLPRELVCEVCCKIITIFCAEYRILPHYSDILIDC